jgi:SagB-type dehydrogenase family enzyme
MVNYELKYYTLNLIIMKSTLLIFSMLLFCSVSFAQEIKLPEPVRKGGMPLMNALNKRKSERNYSSKAVDRQMLSNLLWAAWGVNRESGKRTAPSAMNWQDMQVYVAMEDGLFLFDAGNQSLHTITKEDVRELCGTQDFVAKAPINLIFVSDTDKLKVDTREDKLKLAWAHTGFISQNVYLFCTSEKLGCVIRAMIDYDTLKTKMNLKESQEITLSQTVGWPGEMTNDQ